MHVLMPDDNERTSTRVVVPATASICVSEVSVTAYTPHVRLACNQQHAVQSQQSISLPSYLQHWQHVACLSIGKAPSIAHLRARVKLVKKLASAAVQTQVYCLLQPPPLQIQGF